MFESWRANKKYYYFETVEMKKKKNYYFTIEEMNFMPDCADKWWNNNVILPLQGNSPSTNQAEL